MIKNLLHNTGRPATTRQEEHIFLPIELIIDIAILCAISAVVRKNRDQEEQRSIVVKLIDAAFNL